MQYEMQPRETGRAIGHRGRAVGNTGRDGARGVGGTERGLCHSAVLLPTTAHARTALPTISYVLLCPCMPYALLCPTMPYYAPIAARYGLRPTMPCVVRPTTAQARTALPAAYYVLLCPMPILCYVLRCVLCPAKPQTLKPNMGQTREEPRCTDMGHTNGYQEALTWDIRAGYLGLLTWDIRMR